MVVDECMSLLYSVPSISLVLSVHWLHVVSSCLMKKIFLEFYFELRLGWCYYRYNVINCAVN